LIRDGLPPQFIGEPPRFLQPQRANKDPNVQAQERRKVLKVSRRGYIGPSHKLILSLMNFFSVPKVTMYHKDTGENEVLEIMEAMG
jgi:hypothetical protein